MNFLLSSENVVSYLQAVGLHLVEKNIDQGIDEGDRPPPKIRANHCKNFNLVVRINEDQQFLVKQEHHDIQGKTRGELWFEWRIQELLNTCPAIEELQAFLSRILYFDPENSILVAQFFPQYSDLSEFYSSTQAYPTAIAAALGEILGKIHRLTIGQADLRSFLSQLGDQRPIPHKPRFLRQLDRLGPGLFGLFPLESLQFFQLYQRDPLIGETVQQLRQTWRYDCLIHRDLRFSNVLLHQDWNNRINGDAVAMELPSTAREPLLRVIDWEKFAWGDPAYDLGSAIAAYLRLWLKHLAMHRGMDIQTALRLAAVPLESLQPSLIALIQGYFVAFPELLQAYPDVLERSLQFAGVLLIEKVQIRLEYRDVFGNGDICAMQVARVLLVHPHEAAKSLLGQPLESLLAQIAGQTVVH